ncbi:hypothetical protein [Furfurilactobacillus siliginis]|nr:hypothetical protein [Furfurilactobacillus siliginis]
MAKEWKYRKHKLLLSKLARDAWCEEDAIIAIIATLSLKITVIGEANV